MIRFYNGRTLRFFPELRLGGEEVWVDGSRISYVGPARADAPAFERQIDLRGNLLMPGFKNAHTHTAMTFLRSMADDMPLERWLKEQVWPREARLTDEQVYAFTTLGIMEYLSGGVTACFDMYFHNDAFTAACIDAGFRAVICSALNNFDRDAEQTERDYLKYNALHELISFRLGIHAEYTTGRERLEYAASLAEKYKAPCFTHLSETAEEVEGCLQRYGLTPPRLLDELGFFRYGGGGYHCVHFSDEDIALFAEKGLWAVTCPASNLKLASGVAPIEKLRKAGVRLAIGTDGAASNNALDMFREMYLVSALQKERENDPAACPAEEVLRMACVGGAQAMGLPDCDDLAPGKKADLIVIDLHRPNMQPLHRLAANLVYAGSRDCVRLTMVNGRVLYEDGVFRIGAEPEKVFAEANRLVKELCG
ncbi:MAG: amidohydrolase [Oscillospiraceae bacterium]|nr:amidohydrolase [Oscillospiraceae bacterium]